MFKNVIQSILNACPYSMAGKKCVEVVKGHKKIKKKTGTKIQRFKNGIKSGRHIFLIGLFCPFLWYSILVGASKNFIILNLVHSGIVAGIGLLIMVWNYLALLRYRVKIKTG